MRAALVDDGFQYVVGYVNRTDPLNRGIYSLNLHDSIYNIQLQITPLIFRYTYFRGQLYRTPLKTRLSTSSIMADVQIPKKYKAAVYDKPGSISTKIVELETPEPGPGEVLINLYGYFYYCARRFGIA
jgi:hypothetical protein